MDDRDTISQEQIRLARIGLNAILALGKSKPGHGWSCATIAEDTLKEMDECLQPTPETMEGPILTKDGTGQLVEVAVASLNHHIVETV